MKSSELEWKYGAEPEERPSDGAAADNPGRPDNSRLPQELRLTDNPGLPEDSGLTDTSGVPDDWFISDNSFLRFYPPAIRAYAKSHWTPIRVAKRAADFLGAEQGARVLDIGSGAGKFCLVAAHYRPEAFFYGIEQRGEMVEHAERVKGLVGLQNVAFTHGNITEVDLRHYDHFYFYNSFYENLVSDGQQDNGIEYSEERYNQYNRYLYRQFEGTPSGTRLVTFHSLEPEVPQDFHVVASDMGGLFKCWVKE